MARLTFDQWTKQWPPRRKTTPVKRILGRTVKFESLSPRIVLAVTASFNSAAGTLSVNGDNQDNNIVVSRTASGAILVNGGAVAITGGTPTVANTALIEAFGQGGNDKISLDETNGALPGANLFGGVGNDILTGGSGSDELFGEAGNDTLFGKGGSDLLFGGDNNDTLTGGDGNDQVLGEAGNDRMIWNPGDDSDLNEGGDGIDTVEVNGGNGAESFTTSANGTRVRFDRVTPAPFTLDIGTTENLTLNANGGDDAFTAGNGLAPLIAITVDGGAGNDTITGGDGNDVLMGGDGNDTIIGGRGSDKAFLGAGNDTFVWNPGDGSDTVEGQGDADTLQCNGANVNEKIDLSANGSRLRLTRDVAAITIDAAGIEQVNVASLGGADTITVNNLAATNVTGVNLDLASPAGSGTGDGQADTVIVNATNSANSIQVTGSGTSFAVAGLKARVSVQGAEGLNDRLVVNALGGDDTVTAAGLPAATVLLTIDGGTGNDKITGGDGADTFIGGDDSDIVTGGRGNDVAFLGTGNDTFVWNPGDGSDIVEGQEGHDTLQFNGANVSERLDLSANGSRLRLFRDVANITMDLNSVEQINLATLSGADTVNVNDLSGTGVTSVNVNLAASTGAGDGQADSVVVNGTAAADSLAVSGSGTSAAVTGLSAAVHITHGEVATDRLRVNTLAGNDTMNASTLSAGVIALTVDGGDSDDILTGSAGNDVVIGGRGNDKAFLGAGADTFVWNPGDGSDTVEGQGGADTLQCNGANVNERIELFAVAGRLKLTRDVAAITMDLKGVEQVNIASLGGADNITVNNLAGTGTTTVNLDLSSSPGSGLGDGQADTVTINGTANKDNITVTGASSTADVTGLAAKVHILGADPSLDRLTINTLAGNDVVNTSGLAANAILLTIA